MAGKETSSPSPSPSPLDRIKTVVVLVQENRSFDHMLGWMKSDKLKIDGIISSQDFSNPLNTSDPNSARINFGDKSVFVDPDPPHSFQDIYEEVFGEPWSEESVEKKLPPTMQGFAQNPNRKQPELDEIVMNGFKPDLVPVYQTLVTEFAVCDRWFASVPASTQPNRQYVHSATSHGLIGNDSQKLKAGMPQKTIFDFLDEAGLSFGIYYQLPLPAATLYYSHCKEGKLPNYVVIERRYLDLKLWPGNDDHPSHDVSEGQKFIKKVYDALRSSPQWNEILFVILYDEHGGFADHVPTPVEGVPNPDGLVGPEPYKFQFD